MLTLNGEIVLFIAGLFANRSVVKTKNIRCTMFFKMGFLSSKVHEDQIYQDDRVGEIVSI